MFYNFIITDSGIALMDGNDVQDVQTIGAFQNGFSVMAKMIVGTIVMNFWRTALNATKQETFNVETIDAFQGIFFFII